MSLKVTSRNAIPETGVSMDQTDSPLKQRGSHTEIITVLREERMAQPEVDKATYGVPGAKLGAVRPAHILGGITVTVVAVIAPRIRLPAGGTLE
jgi:hypothetical protein